MKLALSDPLTKFFPDAPAAWQAITLRHLLTHTSGIPDYTSDTLDYRRDFTEEELAKLAFGLALEFPRARAGTTATRATSCSGSSSARSPGGSTATSSPSVSSHRSG